MSTASAQQSRYPDAEIARRLGNTGCIRWPLHAYVADRITRTISLLNRSTRPSGSRRLCWSSGAPGKANEGWQFGRIARRSEGAGFRTQRSSKCRLGSQSEFGV